MFFTAIIAKSVKLKPMVENLETMLRCNLILHLFDAGVLKFNDALAFSADQMIVVMGLSCYRFVAGLTIPEVVFFRNPAFGKELQGPVNSGITDMGMFFADLQVELFSRQVGAGFEKLVKYDFPLLGRFQPLVGKVGAKPVLNAIHKPLSK